MSDQDPDPVSRSSPVPECWYERVQRNNRSFYLKIKDVLEKDQSENVMCYHTSQDLLIQAIGRCILRALDSETKTVSINHRLIYVITELPSANIAEYLYKIIKYPNGTEEFVYPTAMMTVSKIRYNDVTIEFIQTMNDGIMNKYRKDTFRGISGPSSFVIDTTTIKEEFFYYNIVPIMISCNNITFQYLLIE